MKGWGAQDDFQAQIEQTVNDRMAVARAELEKIGSEECVECDSVIPAARRLVYPAAIRCIGCQSFLETQQRFRK